MGFLSGLNEPKDLLVRTSSVALVAAGAGFLYSRHNNKHNAVPFHVVMAILSAPGCALLGLYGYEAIRNTIERKTGGKPTEVVNNLFNLLKKTDHLLIGSWYLWSLTCSFWAVAAEAGYHIGRFFPNAAAPGIPAGSAGTSPPQPGCAR